MVDTGSSAQASSLLAAELWTSFTSLLRSHVAMHLVARADNRLRIVSSTAAIFELLGPNAKLTIFAPAATGMGTTEFRPEAGELGDEYSVFFFTEDGLLRLEDQNEAVDIEAAVEHFLRKVQA